MAFRAAFAEPFAAFSACGGGWMLVFGFGWDGERGEVRAMWSMDGDVV